MAAPEHISRDVLGRMLKEGGPELLRQRLERRLPDQTPLPPRVPRGNEHTVEDLRKRREFLERNGIDIPHLSSGSEDFPLERLEGNIENFVGYASVPVGVVGPLRVNGLYASGDFYIPMATSEGALVASCNRGAFAVSQSGGVSVACLTESVSRAPCFQFRNMSEAGLFVKWVLEQRDTIQQVVASTSAHCRFLDFKTTVTGKEVFLSFEYTTGDASGQNMVTLATDAVCRSLLERAPVQPVRWYIEGNLSGDKKATMIAFLYARGKKVVAEAVLDKEILRRVLRVTPDDLMRFWHVSVLGGSQSGAIGIQGHYANALTALFIACGQDTACVSEASVGVTRMDITEEGDLYVSVSLPNLIVGTVGGGTHLPTARECLGIMDCVGEGKARKFAELCAATALAGEVSISAALAAGDFARAHAVYGRGRPPDAPPDAPPDSR